MKKIILLSFEIADEPNEDQLTAIELDGNSMTYHGFSGFAARDIYNLVADNGDIGELKTSCDVNYKGERK